MNNDFLSLLGSRLVRKNYLNLTYFLIHLAIMTLFSALWLIQIDSENLHLIAFAAFIAVLSEAPFLVVFSKIYEKLPNSNKIRLVSIFLVQFITSCAFVATFYALSPSQYVIHYGGFFIGTFNQLLALVYLYVPLAYLSESIREYRQIARAQKNAFQDLGEFEKIATKRISTEEEKLKREIQETLFPVIDEIREQINKTRFVASAVAEQINDVLKNTVKPLGFYIRRDLELELIRPIQRFEKISAWGSVPRKFNPRTTFNALFTSWFLAPMLISSTLTVTKQSSLLISLLQLSFLWVLLEILKLALPSKTIGFVWAFSLHQLVIWSGLFASSFVGYLLSNQSRSPFTFVAQIGLLIAISSTLYTLAHFTESSMARAKETISESTTKLERSKELLSQKIWIAKRNWSYLIHGRVQAHLLAARLIAQQREFGDKSSVELNSHLNEVMETLRNPPGPDVDLLGEIKDLEDTWRGIATLRFDFDEQALKDLEANAQLRFAVNEIQREAVSNAVKHSNATDVQFHYGIDGTDLVMIVENNGTGPIGRKNSNLGSKMLDELTKEWSLKADKKAKTIKLTARLAK